ncbi:hypothetical protein SAMN02746065_10739 [Desulfocicer vacuolatum DSM 3385]|uniref:Uncharacterized protein n=1 Tax=Desulfocicer vacuolatum DSM 3385 TaxID=1121400 RepID=A0A1W2B742_9BACT|nr:hypothetical protein [Desulfocicer vacuolatum]SMC68797.1 hypothetical protein SAMN02746065_10739 [Desulfocicer vacuolatum DSM 3385]
MSNFAQDLVPEDDLLEDIHQSVDWPFVVGKLKKKYKIAVQDDVAYVDGGLVVHQKKIAYQLDIDVKVRLSVICDKSGNCLKLSTVRHKPKRVADSPGKEIGLQSRSNNSRRQEMARMATGLADMIADINQ